MNPELRRNFWLELSPHRLIGAPVVIAILLLLVWSQSRLAWAAVFSTSVGLFLFVVHFWGMRRASEAVTDEVRERTWDWQRLSSLDPWTMTWGKLWGATAFTWYVGLVCLAAIATAAVFDSALRPNAPWAIAGLATSGITLHAAALAASIQASRKDSRLGARIGTFLLFPVAIMTILLYLQANRDWGDPISWYGVRFDPMRFIVSSSCVFAGWAVLSAYREMQRELKVRTLPWAAPFFMLFIGAYVAGFDVHRASGTAFVFGTFFSAMALAYYGIFADVTTAMSLRRLVLRLRDSQWRRGAEELPLWATALAMAAIFAVLSALQPLPASWNLEQHRLGLYPVAMFLMALRDAGLLVFFALGAKARRVEMTTLLYIFLLTGVLPLLLSAMGLDAVSLALVPFKLGGWQASLVMAVQVAIVWSAALVRGRRMERSLER